MSSRFVRHHGGTDIDDARPRLFCDPWTGLVDARQWPGSNSGRPEIRMMTKAQAHQVPTEAGQFALRLETRVRAIVQRSILSSCGVTRMFGRHGG